jgi:two-component system LytT family sensor kinase
MEDEMKFAKSYLYLIKARFGDAIKTTINISPEAMSRWIPPLSMQVILENIIYTNALNKKEPLHIEISSQDSDRLVITHSLHEKTIVNNLNAEEGLDNLITKYTLLHADPILVHDNRIRRTIILALLDELIIQA